MKTSLLVLMLGAMSTTAYFSTKIYLLLAENKAQAVAAEQKMHEFRMNPSAPSTLPEWKGKRIW